MMSRPSTVYARSPAPTSVITARCVPKVISNCSPDGDGGGWVIWRRVVPNAGFSSVDPWITPAAVARNERRRGFGSPGAGHIGVHGRWRVEERLHDAPLLFHRVLARESHGRAHHRCVEKNLVGSGAFAALLGEFHVEIHRPGGERPSLPRFELDAYARRGVELDDELVRFRRRVAQAEPEVRWLLEDQPDLGLRDREPLACADEERHARPTPVLDVQPQRGVGLGGRIGGDSFDRLVAVVLAAY